MKKRIIALLLSVAMLVLCTVPVYAQENEEFISEVSLIYRDSVEDAKKAIEGTDWKLYDKDLNANADLMFDDGVYLIYKTSTNVEDAITDLRVMDMYGGYSTGNYEQQLQKSRYEYATLINNLSVTINEFKALYNQGNEMARLAYRQLNYYKDAKASDTSDETDMLMGDLLLNVPSTEALVRVLMEGNTLATANILTLLAIGISGSADSSLATRVAEQYSKADTLSDALYHGTASSLYEVLKELRKKVLDYDELKDSFDPNSEDITEEEYNFYTQIAPIISALEEIKLGDKSLCDLVRNGNYEIKDLYPVVAAFTAGQVGLAKAGLFELVLKYANPRTPDEEFYATLENTEKDLKDENGNIVPISVYLGVDRSIFEGSFAMTNAAERAQAIGGDTWDSNAAYEQAKAFRIASMCILGADALYVTSVATIFVITKIIQRYAFIAQANMDVVTSSKLMMGVVKSAHAIQSHLTLAVWAAIGAVLIAAGLTVGGTVYNYYNPNYTEIPNTMVDIRESDAGDRYVKYEAAKVFGEKDKNADFNAYQGKEWIALYYTKDANAGNCLTPNFKYSESSSSVARRHQGVSMFGESKAFNLNSHVYDSDAKPVYLSLRYSTAKKAATEDIPNVVGSLIITGALYTVTAIGGAVVGAGSVILVNHCKKKKQTAQDTGSDPDGKAEAIEQN